MATPEIPIDQKVTERPEGPTFSETLQQAGVTATPVNVKPVVNNQGEPLITTGALGSAKIQLPADPPTLLVWSKGLIENAKTCLGKFFLRKLPIKEKNNSSNTPN